MTGAGRVAALLLCGGVAACSGGLRAPSGLRAAPTPRHMVVWLGPEGIDATTAVELQRVGVDGLVVRRGAVSLAGGSPTARFERPGPTLETSLPVGMSLAVEDVPRRIEPELANKAWSALAGQLRGELPAELLLDLPVVTEGMDQFVARLSAAAGIPVVPILLPDQLAAPETRALVAAARSCLVVVFGEVGLLRPGAKERTEPLEEQLAPLAASGARVRVGVVLLPVTEPVLAQWGEAIDPLCQRGVSRLSTTSRLDRSFVFEKEVTWSGRSWHRGETLAARWVDAARLDAELAEIDHLVLPELAGWDLISLPPTAQALGMGRDALVRFLAGEGPAPEIVVSPSISRGGVSVRLDNPSPFRSAVSSLGNWVEVSLDRGALVAEERGTFDRIVLGTVQGGQWRQTAAGGANAVRFVDDVIGPGERLDTGLVRVPTTGRVEVTVRWQVVLSTGETIGGEQRL